jgi:protein tyrosine phosphatase
MPHERYRPDLILTRRILKPQPPLSTFRDRLTNAQMPNSYVIPLPAGGYLARHQIYRIWWILFITNRFHLICKRDWDTDEIAGWMERLASTILENNQQSKQIISSTKIKIQDHRSPQQIIWTLRYKYWCGMNIKLMSKWHLLVSVFRCGFEMHSHSESGLSTTVEGMYSLIRKQWKNSDWTTFIFFPGARKC